MNSPNLQRNKLRLGEVLSLVKSHTVRGAAKRSAGLTAKLGFQPLCYAAIADTQLVLQLCPESVIKCMFTCVITPFMSIPQ